MLHIRQATTKHASTLYRRVTNRHMTGFSFAGPKSLNEIMKTDLLLDKSKTEVADIWMAYHEEKEGVHGTVLNSKTGVELLQRAEKCPFFIQPVFREGGHFMLLSQHQAPSHFLMAFLEDYKMDPNRAQPLFTFSVFNDLDKSHDLSLLRLDVINKGIEESEGKIVMQNIVDSYSLEKDFSYVSTFNQNPSQFDANDYVSFMKKKWDEA